MGKRVNSNCHSNITTSLSLQPSITSNKDGFIFPIIGFLLENDGVVYSSSFKTNLSVKLSWVIFGWFSSRSPRNKFCFSHNHLRVKDDYTTFIYHQKRNTQWFALEILCIFFLSLPPHPFSYNFGAGWVWHGRNQARLFQKTLKVYVGLLISAQARTSGWEEPLWIGGRMCRQPPIQLHGLESRRQTVCLWLNPLKFWKVSAGCQQSSCLPHPLWQTAPAPPLWKLQEEKNPLLNCLNSTQVAAGAEVPLCRSCVKNWFSSPVGAG